jgi:choline dehydrogenase-like flavoprotein
VANRPALRRVCGGPAPATTRDRAEELRQVREEHYSLPHVVGTCAMGPTPEAGAVVDAKGRVHGVEALFVADASIIPVPPSGFTHVPTIIIAERLAEAVAAVT